MKNIIILIPIYNGIAYTKEALKSLAISLNNTTNIKWHYDIVIIDDGSTDDSCDWIKKNYPDIHVVHGDGNLWWSGSINLGIKYSLNKLDPVHFLLFNNDLIIDPHYFRNLELIIDEYSNDTIIVSKVFYLDEPEKVFSMGAKYNYILGTHQVLNYKRKNIYDYNNPIFIDWSGGMGALIHKNIFERIGFFDQFNFPQYKGDFDFFLRAKKYGYKILAYPNLKIWNNKTQTGIKVKGIVTFIKSFYDKKSQMNIYENIKFYNKHAFPVIGYYGLTIRYIKHLYKFTIFEISIITKYFKKLYKL